MTFAVSNVLFLMQKANSGRDQHLKDTFYRKE
jgi:hypothetical protein